MCNVLYALWGLIQIEWEGQKHELMKTLLIIKKPLLCSYEFCIEWSRHIEINTVEWKSPLLIITFYLAVC